MSSVSELPNLGIIDGADIRIENGIITKIGSGLVPPRDAIGIDAAGRVVMPGLVDCHTHLCWAGSRLDDWDMKRQGAAYLDILAAGGGIMSTVRAVRAASREQLAELLLRRLNSALKLGTTTIEIKSGYGLRTADELKMLRAISDAARQWPGTVVPTALIGHAIDPGGGSHESFVDVTIAETLDAVHAEFPGITIDAFCEQGAWTLHDCVKLFERARSLGHPIRVHADQFNSLGMVREAIRLDALSADHLEASTPEDLAALAQSRTFGVILPCCGFHLDNRYARPRVLLDRQSTSTQSGTRAGGLCLATNSNPGSAPCLSMPMAMAIAVRQCGLSPAEAITASTINPATLLGLADRGRIAEGFRADLLLLETSDERDLAYQFGSPPIALVMCGGRVCFQNASV
ncbi:MAG: imidazolonepropionase [Pyrinomonadaceae bacterium]|nr:imidazolonepropionase [Phycisphaerales bacterium]